MAEEEQKKVTESETGSDPRAEPEKAVAPAEKAVAPPPETEEKPDDSKALVPVKKPEEEKKEGSSVDRDAVLARVETEKRMSLIKAWEEAEKSKVDNKAQKKLSAIGAWENSKKASVEADLKKIELEKQKAEYAEKMKNKIAEIQREAQEKRAMIEARRGEEVLKAEELAAKYGATGTAPKKLFGCF
ncbi:PREDICTED: remorin-like isoform X2 [Tarenaya hassleriana]|uniref:remorin-like isoform X2 n=1 Tax=Tarenaya hassleriana TaxID=28532 RepID=UPI00053C4C72|nr:PREDICTED: remorin-like isoform X2 [Tarenaya hassleriana]